MLRVIILLCFSYEFIFSQETIDVKFNEAVPIWVHTMVDTTFIPVQGQPYYTKYSSLLPHTLHREGSYLYTMAVCLEKQNLDDHGFVLDKIDINSGHKLWSHHNTPYNQGQKDIYHNLLVNNNKIEMVGAVESGDQKYYLSYKIIDDQFGQLIKYTKSNKPLPDFYTRYFTGFVLQPESILLNAYTIGDDIGTINNPIFTYGLNTEAYDDDLVEISSFRNLFDFSYLGPFSISQPNYTLKLNKNTLLSLAYKDRFDSWINSGTKFMWTDISDPNNIYTKQIIDYSDFLPGTKESFSLQRFNCFNNTIHLSHYYPNFDLEQYSCYILWLDSVGKIKTYIPVPKYENHIYQLTDMIYANDDFAYLYAYPSIKNKYGFDIIRIDDGNDTIQYISSLTAAVEGESFVKNFNIHTLYDDGYFVIGGYTTKEGEGTKTALKIYCFKASDLGINFEPVSSTDITYAKTDFNVYPNPTSNTLVIKLQNKLENINVEILDINGKLVMRHNLLDKYNMIDVAILTNGVYLINVLNEKGEKIGNTKKMIKVE